MPRANRHYLPGHVWHITHRCHKKEFLLKFSRDRRRWIQWLYQAKHRYGLCVLNYLVTSNHIHLLVQDTGEQVIAKSLQLIAGRTAQEYNQRKQRKGAYWEDRYHATLVATDHHFINCLVYIDLNMVRAGVVKHPADWPHGGYREIQEPPQRYRIIDTVQLLDLVGIKKWQTWQQQHRLWIDEAIALGKLSREPGWTESLAVGNARFIQAVQNKLGAKAIHRTIKMEGDKYLLREMPETYDINFDGEIANLNLDNKLK